MIRVRFEPIDVTDKDDFVLLYNMIRECMNRLYKNDHHELLPSIRKMYAVDEMGFPLDPTTDNS